VIKTACYIRVSTDRQAKEGDSVPAQRDALRKYLEEHDNMISAGEYIDDGVSGRKFQERGELQRLIDDIKAGKVDMIIFTKLDRWFRSIRHYTATQEVLDKYGVTWLAIWEPIYDTTTPAGRLVVNQMMSVAQFEAENTSARIRAVMDYKVAQGEAVTGKVPFGYRIQDKHLVVVPEKAEIIRKVFDYYCQCGSLNEAARYGQRIGLLRQKQNLKRLLRNRKYIGEHRGNSDYCEPIIDKAVFEDVQRKLAMNVSAAAKRDYLFTGLLRCGVCGHRMATVFTHNRTTYRCPCYYVPPRRCTNKKQISEAVLEEYLIAKVKQEAEKVIVEAQARKEVKKDTEKQKAAIKRKIDRLKELYLAELIGLEEYRQDREGLEGELAALDVEEAPPDTSALEGVLAVEDIGTLISSLTMQERRYLWRGLLKEIRFFDDRHIELIFL